MVSPAEQTNSDRRSASDMDAALSATHGVVYQCVVGGVTAVGGYTLHVVAARWLNAPSYGRFVLALSILLWGKNVQKNLFLPGLSKSVSEDHCRLSAALHIAKGSYSYAAFCLLLLLWGLALALGVIFGDWKLALVVGIGACEIPFAAAHTLSSILLSSTRRFGRSSGIRALYATGRAAIGCGLILVGFGAAGGVVGQVVGSAGAAVLGMHLLRSVRGRLSRVDDPQMWSRALSWTWYTLPFILVLSSLLSLDLWMVGALIHSEAATGIYGAAYSLSRAPRLLAAALGSAIFPRVSGALAAGNESLAQSVANDALRTVVIVFVPTCVLVGESSGAIITLLFSQRYIAASWPLVFLMTAGALETTLMVLLSLLASVNRPGLRLSVVAGMLPFSLALNLLLIPIYGLVGAAAGTLIVMASGSVVALFLMRQRLKVGLPVATCIRCGTAGVLIGIAAFVWPATGVVLIGKLLTLGGVYVGLLLFFGEVRRREMEMVINVLPESLGKPLLSFLERIGY